MLNYQQKKILVFGICGAIAGLISYSCIQYSGINNRFSNLEFPSIFNFDLDIHGLLILGFNASILVVLFYLGHIYVNKIKFQLISLLKNILFGFFCVTVGYLIVAILPISEFAKLLFSDETSRIEFILKHVISVYAIFFALSSNLKLERIGFASIICGIAAVQYVHIWNFGINSIIVGFILNGLTLGVIVAFFNPKFSDDNNKNLIYLVAQRAKKIIINKNLVESSK